MLFYRCAVFEGLFRHGTYGSIPYPKREFRTRGYLAINKSLTASEVKYKNIVFAWVAELVDARDLKSLGPCARTSSILVLGTT